MSKKQGTLGAFGFSKTIVQRGKRTVVDISHMVEVDSEVFHANFVLKN